MKSSRRRFLAGGAGAVAATAMWQGQTVAAEGRQNPANDRPNWGRWGKDDQKGALNLITPAKRVAAAGLVKTGRTVSLSRMFTPTQHYIRINERGTGNSVVDYFGFEYHGVNVTHLDALCHMYDRDGMWNGRDPAEEIDTRGTNFGDIAAFGDGIVTRGVLLDVPRHRGVPHVTMDRPVTGEELAQIAKAQNVTVGAGDALLVYCGLESYVAAAGRYGTVTEPRPGLHNSCPQYIRDHDVAVLGWDMLDARPDPDGLPFPVHRVLYRYGVALLDNALLAPLAQACAAERRYEFLFMASPLKIARATGSPINPLALF